MRVVGRTELTSFCEIPLAHHRLYRYEEK